MSLYGNLGEGEMRRWSKEVNANIVRRHLEVRILALEEAHPREERVLGRGARRAAAQNRPVLLKCDFESEATYSETK